MIVNTKKGKDWVEKVADAMYTKEYPIEKACINNPPLVKPMNENDKRENFFEKLNSVPIEENLNENIAHTNQLKLQIVKVLISMRLYKPLWKVTQMLRNR